MRALTTLFAFVFLAAAFTVLDQATRPKDENRPRPASAEALSIAEVLTSHAGLAVMGIVLGPRSGNERDFRGLHSIDGRMRPIYGRARAVCTGLATRPACWEIAYLEIDGRQVAGRTAAVESDPDRPQGGGDWEIETADTGSAVSRPTRPAALPPTPPPTPSAATGAAPAAIAGPPAAPGAGPDLSEREATGAVPIPAVRPPAEAAADVPETPVDTAPRPTHAVARPIINVRDGPGTDQPVVARLPEGMRLALIDRRDDWGRFLVLDGASSGREVWAALRILEPLP